MQMAKAKLYRMPLSNSNREEGEEMAIKVCFGCSMRHITGPEVEVAELDEDGGPFRVYHIDCAPKEAVATPLQFIQRGFGEEKAKEMAERLNKRIFLVPKKEKVVEIIEKEEETQDVS